MLQGKLVERQVPRRWSPEWCAFVAETGRWDLPRVHRNAHVIARSPWDRDMVSAAIYRAREVFTPEVAKRVFSNPSAAPTLYSLLFSLSAPTQNELFRFGLDLLAVLAVRPLPPRLRDDLRLEESYWGARFELAMLAAACRASLQTIFEPLQHIVEGRKPDLLVVLEQPTFVELKAINPSGVWRQRENTYMAILLGGRDGTGMGDLTGVDIAFTDDFTLLDATHEGRCQLEREADQLGRSIAAAARHMSSNSAIVNGLVRLTIAKDGELGKRPPLIPNYKDEAARIVNDNVLNACGQLPPSHPGLVVIETERSLLSVQELIHQTQAWFDGPIGCEYEHVAGVLYTYRPWWTKFPCVQFVPVWRSSAPQWLVRSHHLRDLANGLRWADVCAWGWRRKTRH